MRGGADCGTRDVAPAARDTRGNMRREYAKSSPWLFNDHFDEISDHGIMARRHGQAENAEPLRTQSRTEF